MVNAPDSWKIFEKSGDRWFKSSLRYCYYNAVVGKVYILKYHRNINKQRKNKMYKKIELNNNNEPTETSKKSKKSKIIWVLVGVIILLVGVIGYFSITSAYSNFMNEQMSLAYNLGGDEIIELIIQQISEQGYVSIDNNGTQMVLVPYTG